MKGDLKTDTASEVITTQGKALHTRYCVKMSLKTETRIKCRLRPQYEETVDHIITVQNIGKRQNTNQYDRVYVQLHSVMVKQRGVKFDKQHGCEKVTSEYTTHKSYLAIKLTQTYHTINRKISSVIVEGSMLIDIVVSRDRNETKREVGKIFKMT